MVTSTQDRLHICTKTDWDEVLKGRGDGPEAFQARRALLVRYHEAAYHYFVQALPDSRAAQELQSIFAFDMIESDLLIRNADPKRDSFWHHLKAILCDMVIDYLRQQKEPRPER